MQENEKGTVFRKMALELVLRMDPLTASVNLVRLKVKSSFTQLTLVKKKQAMREEYYEFSSKLAKEFPNKWIATMAYSLRKIPSQGVYISLLILRLCTAPS